MAESRSAERVVFGIQLAHERRGGRRVEQTSVFGGEQKDEAIDQSQELSEEFRQGQLVRGEAVTQRGVL